MRALRRQRCGHAVRVASRLDPRYLDQSTTCRGQPTDQSFLGCERAHCAHFTARSTLRAMFAHWRLLVALAAFGIGVIALVQSRDIEHPPGVLVDDEPKQTRVERASFALGEYQLTPLADFEVEARVLSVERYRTDRGAGVSPIDFALGWGPMSDSAVLEHFRIRQGGRFFSIHPDEHAIELRTAMLHASNMHLIPADADVFARLKQVKRGNVVRLRGQLVRVRGADGFTWTSSLSRSDTGAGACELFYVQSLERR